MTFDLNSLRIEVKGRVTKGRVATGSNFMKVAGDQICLNLLWCKTLKGAMSERGDKTRWDDEEMRWSRTVDSTAKGLEICFFYKLHGALWSCIADFFWMKL